MNYKILIVLVIGLGSVLSAEVLEENMSACENGNPGAYYEARKIYSVEAYKEEVYRQVDAAFSVAGFYRESCRQGYVTRYAAKREENTQKDARYFFQKACDGGDEIGSNLTKLMLGRK